ICSYYSIRSRHTSFSRDWSSDVCSSDLVQCRTCGSIAHQHQVDVEAGQQRAARDPFQAAAPTLAALVGHEHGPDLPEAAQRNQQDRKSTRLNSSHVKISYAVFCLKKKNK